MGVEPTQDRITAPQTVLKFAGGLRRLPQRSFRRLRNPCKSDKLPSCSLRLPLAPVGTKAPNWHQENGLRREQSRLSGERLCEKHWNGTMGDSPQRHNAGQTQT